MTKKECDCIFCKSKCPECGSEKIEVTYSPVFNYRNESKDRIFISLVEGNIELMCQECDAWIERNDCRSEPKKLEGLIGALNKALGIPGNKVLDYDEDHGEIRVSQRVDASHVSKKIDKP